MINLGIDLGTTNTVVCRARNGIYEYFQLDNNNNNMMPSVMRYSKNGIVVGINAKNSILESPEECIYNSKIHMGTDKTWSIRDRTFTARDVAEEILKKVYNRLSEQFPGEELVASISVPACFTQKQIALTYDAAEKSGFTVKNVVPEPVAAAKAARMNGDNSGKLFVVDIGGGTFDITAMQNEIGADGTVVAKCLAVGGDRRLGGNTFDEYIFNRLIMPAVNNTYDPDSLRSLSEKVLKRGEQVLRAIPEKIKLHFQNAESTYCESVCDVFDDEHEIELSISYSDYLSAIALCGDAARTAVIEVLDSLKNDYDILPHMFDNVLVVGGMAREKIIRTVLTEFFDNEKIHIASRPMSFVAEGVARFAIERDVRVPCMLSVDIGLADPSDSTKLYKTFFQKNTPIDQLSMQAFRITNAQDNMEKIGVVIYEKEGKKCNRIGELFINIPPKPVGENDITVFLLLNQNRILTIQAVDNDTNKNYKTEFRIE